MVITESKNVWRDVLIKIIAISMSIFQLYTAATIPFTAIIQRSLHLGFALSLVFLIYPFKTRSGRTFLPLDIILFLMAVASSIYIITNFDDIAMRTGVVTTADIVFGTMMIIVVLEGTRRTLGKAMPLIALIFLVYARFGYLLPSGFGHMGYNLGRIVNTMYLSTEGIWGIPLSVSATFVAVFIIFGVMLQRGGGGDFLFGIANSLLGHVRGGPAKVAVVSSGLMGMLSGSVVANIVTCGTFTIPMMIKTGFKKEFAGAVEACASTGGVIMPPIMGTAAFIIAEILGISYWKVAVAAFVPAVLYYAAIFTAVHLRAKTLDLKVMTKDEREPLGFVMRTGWMFLFPIFTLIYMLGWSGISELRAGFFAIVATLIILAIFRRVTIKPAKLLGMLEAGGKGLVEVAMACACAGIIVGVFSLTGLGLKLSSLLLTLSGGNQLVLLFLTMVCCLILGMGVTPAAAYIVLAVLVAPALIKMGVVPLAAHLFIFYYSIYANITPPVAVGAYASSAIAKADPTKTGFIAFRLAIPGLIVPYTFVYSPVLLLQGTVLLIGIAIITSFVGVIVMASSLEGHFLRKQSLPIRVILFLASLCLIIPGITSDLIGIAVVGVIAAISHFQLRAEKTGKAIGG